ncbi:hypothetical protein Anas_05567 [Armadillidium nasatum]|uniref:Uncharacterized protein n=1 Tax=Armadillidium nasatum TaxID=96803 RepID=A0A5N5TMD2_9CRUS|nr:hypothetical protein Anas_05567 [Armadillidium nasatum]
MLGILTNQLQNLNIILLITIYCIAYENGKYVVHENPLACIPNGSEIVSLNVMRNNTNRFNVGLTLLKDGSSDECFFNVYMDWDVDKSICSGQETSTAGFSSSKLNFIPYVLFPTTLPTAEGDELQGITLYLDLHYVHQRKSRFTLTSGESGNVHLFNVDVSLPKSPKILSSQKVQFDFPSSCCKVVLCI